MTGYPCCCGDAQDSNIFCYSNEVSGIASDALADCGCPDCIPLNKTYYTGDPFVAPVGGPTAGGFMCGSGDRKSKCHFDDLPSGPFSGAAQTFFAQDGTGDWFLFFLIGSSIFSNHFVRWSANVGAVEPNGDATDVVLTYESSTMEPGWSCDVASSTVTVNRIDSVGTPAQGIPLDCGPADPCDQEQFPGVSDFCGCVVSGESRSPASFALTFPGDWTLNQCEVRTGNCIDVPGQPCVPTGILIADADNEQLPCTFRWEFTTGNALQAVVKLSVRLHPQFGITASVSVDMGCGFRWEDPPTGNNQFDATARYEWSVSNANLLCGDGADCFFGGTSLSIPFSGQGFLDQGLLTPFPPWANPCCTWGSSALTLGPA